MDMGSFKWRGPAGRSPGVFHSPIPKANHPAARGSQYAVEAPTRVHPGKEKKTFLKEFVQQWGRVDQVLLCLPGWTRVVKVLFTRGSRAFWDLYRE